MQASFEDRSNVFCTIFAELKSLGLKVPKIKKFSKQAKPVSAVSSSSSKIFGVPISEQEQVQVTDYLLPKFVAISTAYLKKFTEKHIGIFRKQGLVSRQRDLRVKLENGGSIEESEPNDIASLLKQWLRELPVSLVPSYLQDLFVRCLSLQVEENRIKALVLCCHLLPVEHLYTLKHLLDFLKDIADNSDKNKMGAHNLSLIMAPNIFIKRTDFTDKSRDLVQQHACVIEILINNVHLIKNFSCSSLHLAEVEALKCNNDLNDVFDYSPTKSSKKRSGGPVQDLFRKFVGQNSASKRKAEYEELPMSPLKKLATSCSVSQNETSNFTPNNKSIQGIFKMKNKTSSTQSHRKPFGILKKDKKRQKSVKPNASIEKNLASGTPYPFKDKLEESFKEGALESSFENSSTLSSINIDKLFSKSLSVKKSVSGYLTVPQEAFENKHLFSASSSEGCLQPVGNNQSPYYLRSNSKKAVKQKSDEKNIKPEEMAEIVYKDEENNGLSCSPWFNRRNSKTSPKRSPKEIILIPKDVNKLSVSEDNATHNSNCFDKIYSMGSLETSFNETFKNENAEHTGEIASLPSVCKIQKPVYSEALTRSDITDVNNAPSGVLKEFYITSESSQQNGETVRKCSVSQEALGVKSSSRKKTFRNSQLKRADSIKLSKSKSIGTNWQNVNLNCNTRNDVESGLNYTSEVNPAKTIENALINVPDKKRTRRNVRSKSIIRGRPNTVKTGLRSDVCNRYNKGQIESVACNSKHQLHASASVDNDLLINVENNSQDNAHDMSITLQVQNITLSSPQEEKSAKDIDAKNVQNSVSVDSTNTATDDTKASAVITVTETMVKGESDAVDNRKSNTVTETETTMEVKVKSDAIDIKKMNTVINSVKVRRSASGKKERERLCSNSDSKIHKMKKRSSTITRINSFPESGKKLKPRNAKKLRAIKSSSPKKSIKREITNSTEVEKENVYVQESSKTPLSHFSVPKTPEASMQSPMVWINGKEFLENEEIQEESFNKRESIAMILKNNTGHVKAKVHQYDYKTRSCSVTPVMSRNSMPGATLYDPQYSDLHVKQSQKKSASVKSNRFMRRNSPLPPPPKFFISEFSPLKELTNISNSEDIVFIPSPAKKSHSTRSNVKTVLEKTNKSCTLKPKRNSFSGHTPFKFPAGKSKVFRSESSPVLSKVSLSKKLQESSTTNQAASLNLPRS